MPSRSGRLIAYELERTSDTAPAADLEYALAVRELDGGERLMSPWSRGAFMPSEWSHDDRAVLGTYMRVAYTGAAQLAEWPIGTSAVTVPTRILLTSPTTQFWQGRYSPDHRWVGFTAVSLDADRPPQLGIAPAHSRDAATWTPIAVGHGWPDKPRWSPDGRTLYFLSSASGGFVNLWGAHIDPTRGAQVGAASR